MHNQYNIPQNYGDNKIVLMARDPYTMFTYWEVQAAWENSLKSEIDKRGLSVSKSILRVYDVTENDPDVNPKIVYDFELRDWAYNWYIHTDNSGREWMVDIGLLCTTGEFFILARSNRVRTPSDKMSDTRADSQGRLKKLLAYIGFSSAMIGDKNQNAGKK